ncbi:MAG: hypothetical protein FWG15_01555 [Propionibacteriaceae bacterium]|nr:hypothetical protein [Propionibacteriaceae bacterium]
MMDNAELRSAIDARHSVRRYLDRVIPAQVRTQLNEDEDLALVIALGYGETQGKPHQVRPIERFAQGGDGAPMPDWFMSGLEMVALAPSARHQQKFFFTLDGNQVSAHRGGSYTGYTGVDLGIAKLHFEIGAFGGTWSWA